MGSWTIYNKNGVAKAVVKELELHDEWMAECFLTLTINSATPIQFAVGDYIDYRNERYTIEYDPNVIKRATSGTYGEGFVYDGIKFVGSQDEIVRCDFNDIVLSDNNVHYTALPTFPFYCESVDDLLDRIQANLEDLYPNQWIVIGLNTVRNSQRGSAVGRQTAFENAYKKWIDPDMTPHTDPYGKQSVAESADNITCWDALAKVHEDFGLNFIVRGKVVVVGTAGVFTANTFQYGKGNGLEEIEKVGDSSQQIVTRLRAYGSETNLPSHYYSALNMRPYGLVSSLADNNRVILDVLFEDRYFTTPSQSGGKSVTILVGESTASTSAYQGTNNNIVLHLEGIQVSVGDKIYFTEGVKRDMWPSDHKDYTEDALPENMAVSRLMLPMFPNTSLYDWVKAHRDAGTTYNDETGLATYHGITAYFSKEPHRPYIDSLNKAQYGVRPASIYFDGSNETEDIHPTIEGMTYNNVHIDAVYAADQIEDNGVYDDSSVEVPNFHITLPDLGFNLAEVYEENASIDMKDGMCGGRSFKLAAKPTQDSNGRWVCEVQREKDDNLNLFFPYCDFQISSGDHYVLTGIQMPDAYIEAAAVKLLGAALDALQKNEAPRFTYQPKIDKNFMQRQHDTAMSSQGVVSLHDTLKAGDVFVFADADMGVDASIIIDVLTIKENGDNGIPTYEVTLRDEKQVSTIQKIQNKIDSVINGAININSGVGGLTAQQVRSLINNYGGEQFLSKLNDDTAAGFITMLKGLQIGANFVPDILGEGGCLRMRQDGKVELVTDILYARMRAYFDSVVIREYRHESGNRIKSPAQGFNASRVENIKVVDNVETIVDDANEADFFRCYWRVDDGEKKAENQFIIGDLAFCEHSDVVNGSLVTKRYWRVVVGRNAGNTTTADGEAWIDLSNAHDTNGNPVMTTISWEGQGGATQTLSVKSFESSANSYPEAHDDICMLGCTTDTTRQGAIIEYVSGVDAPTYQIYQGLGADATNPYSLSGKNQITIGYNSATGKADMKVYGDAYIGDRNRSTYIEYKQDDGTPQHKPVLNIKAHVEFTNTDQELDTLVQNHQKTYDNAIAALIRETEDLQAQIDGAIESYFMEGEPSLTTPPVMNTEETHYEEAWLTGEETQEERIAILNKHIGDLYYDKETGHGYRFLYDDDTSAYVWTILTDEDVTEALRLASEAQETADGKSTTFLNNTSDQDESKRYPTNYKKGDTWILQVDATIGTTAYKAGEILTASTDSETYSAAHWSKQVRYTDDTKADSILNNSYYQQLTGGTISQNITNAANAASAAQSAANNAQSTANAAQTSATAANNKLNTWADDGVISPTEKLALKNQKADVEKEYAQIIVDAAKYTGVSTTAFTTAYNRAITAFNYYTADSPEDITIITDEDEDTDATPRYSRISAYYAARQTVLNDFATAAKKYATDMAAAAAEAFKSDAVYRALKSALGSKTDIVGGLVLTSLIGMRQQGAGGTYTTWGGISGEYDALAKGGGIAAWYGGDMFDREDVDDSSSSSSEEEEEPRYATSLFRFDGSGYLASGNITWDEQGRVSIKDVTTIISNNNTDVLNELITFNNAFHFNLSQGTSTVLSIEPQAAFTNLYIRNTTNPNAPYHVATENWVDDHYVSKTFFRQLFRAFKPNETAGQADVEVQPNTIDATISNIKAMVGFWTEQYVSALGNSSDGGGGGASVLYGLNDVTPNATGDGVMGAQDGYVLTYNGSTHHWYAAPTAETYVLPTATANALGGIKIGYSGTGKNYPIVLDNDGKAYVNVPWTDTTYTLAGLMGSSAIGGTTQPIYWNGSAFTNCTSYANASVNYATSAGSAAQLTTSRSIWGQSFDGTGDISISTYAKMPYILFKNYDNDNAAGYCGRGSSSSNEIQLFAYSGNALKLGANDTTAIYIDTSANVGIGTTSPSYKFDTRITKNDWAGHIYSEYSSTKSSIYFASGAGHGIWCGVSTSDTSHYIARFIKGMTSDGSGGTDALYIRADGNIGIGTSSPSYKLHVNGNIAAGSSDGTFIQIGGARIVWDNTNKALKVIQSDNSTAANFYATGAISALGQGVDGGGGCQGDVTWDLLSHTATNDRFIDSSYISGTLANYLPLSGGTISTGGYLRFADSTYQLSVSTNDRLSIGSNGQSTAKGLNVGDLLVSSSWANYDKVPTNGIYSKGVIRSGVASGTAPFTIASTTVVTNLNADYLDGQHGSYYAAASSLNNYLPLAGGTMTGELKVNALAKFKCGYFYKTNPTLGSLSNGTFVINASSNQSGDRATYGLYIWDDAYNGTAKLQSGYENGTTSALGLALQPLGGKVGVGYSGDVRELNYTFSVNGSINGTSVYYNGNACIHAGNIGSQSVNYATSSGSCSGNAASATQLQTSRTIWGQSFDGTGDISISTYAKMPYILFKNYDNDNAAGYCGRGSNGNNRIELAGYTNNPVAIYTNNNVLALFANTSGNVGIKTNSPSYALHVSGTLYASGSTSLDSPLTFLESSANNNKGIINVGYNGATYDVIWNHGNGNISIDSCGGGLYLGYLNTTTIYARGTYINLDSGNWSSYIGTSTAYVGYANYATSAGSATSANKLTTARSVFGCSFDGTADITGPAVIRDGGYASGNSPSLGALNNKTIAFLSGYGNSGQPYGLYYWCEATSGRVCLQCGRQDGNTATYPICLQPLGGKVGIGTQTPTQLLEVNGAAECRYMLFNSTSGSTPSGYCGRGGSSNSLQLSAYNGSLGLGANNGDSDIFINTSHNVGIGTSSPSYKLHVSGDIYATGGVTCASDARMKDVIGGTTLSVEQVANAPAVRFLWKKDHSLGMQAGSIAQYWQNVLPETIKEDNEGILSMNYGVAALISAITTARKVVDHEKEIAQLKNRVKALEDENKMLKTKLIA